jgi:hypothetical protein
VRSAREKERLAGHSGSELGRPTRNEVARQPAGRPMRASQEPQPLADVLLAVEAFNDLLKKHGKRQTVANTLLDN